MGPGDREPDASQPVIRIRGLRYRYPGADRDILRIPFLDISGNGPIAVTGPSGVGKSTLIELLAGTIREHYAGSLQVLGREWKELSRDVDRQRQLRKIGLIPQDYGLLADRTPTQMLEQDLADAGIGRPDRQARLSLALEQVGLDDFADRRISTLSGGQCQRVAIARMLARDVQLVIADEPTANLDGELTRTALDLFRQLAARTPVVIITHDPAVAEACERTIVLQSTVGDEADVNRSQGRSGRRWPWLAGVGLVIALGLGGGLAASQIHRDPTSAAPGSSTRSAAATHEPTAVAAAAALSLYLARYRPNVEASRVVQTRQGPLVAIAHSPGQFANATVEVLRYTGTAWVELCLIHLQLGSAMPDVPDAIEPMALSGLSAPGFLVQVAGADHTSGVVVADLGGSWALVPFAQGYATSDSVLNPVLGANGTVSRTVDDCEPDCAYGAMTTTWFRFDPVTQAFEPTAR